MITTIVLALICLVLFGLWLQLPEKVALKIARSREKNAREELANIERRNEQLVNRIASLISSPPNMWFDEDDEVVLLKEPYRNGKTLVLREQMKISEYEIQNAMRYRDHWMRLEHNIKEQMAGRIANTLIEKNLLTRWETSTRNYQRNDVEHTILLEVEIVEPQKMKHTQPVQPFLPKPIF